MLLLAVLPAYCGEALMRATERFLPRRTFVYLPGNGFFGTMAMQVRFNVLSFGVLAYMLLLSWGESFLIGFLLTFDDNIYLRGK